MTISPDGRYGVLAREGASNRVNGVVILDLANPAHPKIASSFSQELTGGVHNMFATNEHLFAVSGGAKYVIIDVRDIYHPKYVSEYRHPNARLHDLWVHDGIAYSAQGGAGTTGHRRDTLPPSAGTGAGAAPRRTWPSCWPTPS